jgi:hypothetical protein
MTPAMMPSMIRRGDALIVEGVAGGVLVTRDAGGEVHRLQVGPVPASHVDHAVPAAGDRLSVMRDAAPNGDTLVSAPCGCSILLLAAPAR